MSRLELIALSGIPAVRPGDDLAALILNAAREAALPLRDGILVVCQKVVSKAEGRVVALADVTPS
ncbi:MAG TPA: coenzyme F420-0:L-glutamate ligase, partial [Myxococcota bacterium]